MEVAKAMLPRSETIKKKLVKLRLEKIEEDLVQKYNDQVELDLDKLEKENAKD